MKKFLVYTFLSVMSPQLFSMDSMEPAGTSVYCRLNFKGLTSSVKKTGIGIGIEELQSQTHHALLDSGFVKNQSQELTEIPFDQTNTNLYEPLLSGINPLDPRILNRRTGLFVTVNEKNNRPQLMMMNQEFNNQRIYMHTTLIYNDSAKAGKHLKDLPLVQQATESNPNNIVNFYKNFIDKDQFLYVKNLDIFGNDKFYFLIATLTLGDKAGGEDRFSLENNDISTDPLHITLAKFKKGKFTSDKVWTSFKEELKTINNELKPQIQGRVLQVKEDIKSHLADVRCDIQK